MASGLTADVTPGLALNTAPGTDAGWNNPTTRGWVQHRQRFWVSIEGDGHRAVEPIVDLGPAGFVGRAIDFTAPATYDLGLSPGSFPTDAMGTAKLIPGGCI